MKKIVAFVFVFLLFLLTSSCASSPNWTGAETQTGEFVWSESPGIRFYVHVILLGAFLLLFTISITKEFWRDRKQIKDDTKGFLGGFGCFTLIFLFVAFFLWVNIHRCIWRDSLLINQDRIEHISYSPVIYKAEKTTKTLEWKNVTGFYYASHKTFESTTWVKVAPITRERIGTGQRTEGIKGRAIIFKEQSGNLEFALEKQSFGKDFGGVLDWIFGSEDYAFSPEEEARLKAAINKFLPEDAKQKMSPETKEYLSK